MHVVVAINKDVFFASIITVYEPSPEIFESDFKTKESKMKNRCPLCEGNKTEGTITYTVDLGFGVVVVRGVPAKICTQCGEEWIDASVARSLETIVLSAKAKHSPVEVVGYH